MARKVYTQEFKDEAVRLAQTSGKGIRKIAADLGINYNTLLSWRDDAISERRLPVPDNESAEQKIRRLEMELKLVTEERDIIKKAIAYFAQPPKK